MILPKLKWKNEPEEPVDTWDVDIDPVEEPRSELPLEVDEEPIVADLNEEILPEAPVVTEAVPIPEKRRLFRRREEKEASSESENQEEKAEQPGKEKRPRKEKKPREIWLVREEPEGTYLRLMLGREEQDALFVPCAEKSENGEESPEETGKRIRRERRKAKLRCKRAAYLIPEEESEILTLTLPRMPEKQIPLNLPSEFRKALPNGIRGYLFDYAHVKEEPEEQERTDEAEEDGQQKTILAAAVPTKRMEHVRRLMGAAGLSLVLSAPESLAEESYDRPAPTWKTGKDRIDFTHVGEKRIHPAAAVLTAIVVALIALAVAKFGVIDRYARYAEEQEKLEALQQKIENGKAALAEGEETIEDYGHYTWSGMTDEECEQIERIRIGALLNYISGEGARVKSASLSGRLLTVSLTADSLEAVSALTASIEEQDIVESCTVTTAEKEERNDEINYAEVPSEVMEVEVDDSIPTEDEDTSGDHEKPGKHDSEGKSEEESADAADSADEAEGEEPAALPEVTVPEGTVEAQLRIYLKKRSDTLGSAEEELLEQESLPEDEMEMDSSEEDQ